MMGFIQALFATPFGPLMVVGMVFLLALFLGRSSGRRKGYREGFAVGCHTRAQDAAGRPNATPTQDGITREVVASVNGLERAFTSLQADVTKALNVFAAASRDVKRARTKNDVPAVKHCRHCGQIMTFYAINTVETSSCSHRNPVLPAQMESMARQFEVGASRSLEAVVADLRGIVDSLRDHDDQPAPDLVSYWTKLRAGQTKEEEEK